MKIHVLAVLMVSLLCTLGYAQDLALIINKATAQTSISKQEAKNIFLGKKSTWRNGQPMVVVTQEESKIHEVFTRTILHKSPQQFSTYWKRALFTGTGTQPRVLGDDGAVKAFVATQVGSIGYISKTALDGTVKELEVQ